jgi:hypothetical protein
MKISNKCEVQRMEIRRGLIKILLRNYNAFLFTLSLECPMEK